MDLRGLAAADGWEQEYAVKLSAAGHVGLSNQGATCYLNSLLQTLFISAEFRAAVFRAAGPAPGTDDPAVELGPEAYAAALRAGEEDIPWQLALLFARLAASERRAVDTTQLTRAFGWGSAEVV